MRIRTLSSLLLSLATAAAVLGTASTPAQAVSGTPGPDASAGTVVARYGPYTVPGMSHLENQIDQIPLPCSGCFVTGMRADLVYADGRSANYDTGGMLHHVVFLDLAGNDATCANAPGERFFASGNERTPLRLPNGYGYRVSGGDRWVTAADVMNMSMSQQTFYIEVTYTVTTSAQTPVRPVWLDIDQCGDSEYAIPAGVSDTHWDWRVNVPGRVVTAAGHLHDSGVHLEATRETGSPLSICDSVAGYGETPGYIDPSGRAHLSSMSTCEADPLAVLSQGDMVRIHSVYDSPEPQTDVMGIMLMYIA